MTGLLGTLKREHGLGEGTLQNYRKTLRKFYDWRGHDCDADLEIGAAPSGAVDPDELLTQDEIDALLETTENARDKAAIAMLADTGLRIDAIASLRIRDLELEGQVGEVSINEEGNVKGASGRERQVDRGSDENE